MCRSGSGGKHSGQKEHQCSGTEMGINLVDFEPEQ